MIVTGMQLWNKPNLQPPDMYARLLSLFFNGALYSRLVAGYWSSDPRRFVFHRRQVLLIAKLAMLHCSGRGVNARLEGQRFGVILLKANDQLHYNLIPQRPSMRVGERDDYAKIVTEMLAVGEHASSNIAHMITRSHLMLTRFLNELRGDPDFVDVAEEHQRATGLTTEQFEALVFATHARFGEELGRKLFVDPGVLPLKDANFAGIAVPEDKVKAFIDSLAATPSTMIKEILEKDNGPNDLTIFRKYPLVQQYYNLHLRTAWCGFLMMDNLFFLEKIQTGPYWNANAKHGARLHKFWGSVFESYVNELMRQTCTATKSTFVPDPRPANNPGIQLCDGIVVSSDSIVLMEYKSSMFRADSKYSGDYSILADEIEKKLVRDKATGRKKGVYQLSDSVRRLFDPGNPISVPGVDLTKVKRVYLYIVTLDTIGETIGVSPLLETFLNHELDRSKFPSIEIRPLFCSDIETLEYASGFFGACALPEVLERWFITNPSLTTPLSTIDLERLDWSESKWLRDQWFAVYKKMVTILFPDKDPDIALADAIRLGQGRRRPGI